MCLLKFTVVTRGICRPRKDLDLNKEIKSVKKLSTKRSLILCQEKTPFKKKKKKRKKIPG